MTQHAVTHDSSWFLLNRNDRLLVDDVIETSQQVACLPDDITEGQDRSDDAVGPLPMYGHTINALSVVSQASAMSIFCLSIPMADALNKLICSNVLVSSRTFVGLIAEPRHMAILHTNLVWLWVRQHTTYNAFHEQLQSASCT